MRGPVSRTRAIRPRVQNDVTLLARPRRGGREREREREKELPRGDNRKCATTRIPDSCAEMRAYSVWGR